MIQIDASILKCTQVSRFVLNILISHAFIFLDVNLKINVQIQYVHEICALFYVLLIYWVFQ